MNPSLWFASSAQDSGQIAPDSKWRTGDELLTVRGDFGSVRDAKGRNMFSPFLLTLMDELRLHEAYDWLDRWQARRYTHVVLTPRYSYPNSPIAGRDFDPNTFAAYVRVVLNWGFSPVIMLSDLPTEPIRERALALKELWPYCILVPGWETIGPGGAWTSKQMSDCLIMLHDLGVPYIGAHLQPGRWSMSSHPVEPDDPWQGNEQACWKSHGGEHVKVFLVQTEHDGWNQTPMLFEDRLRDGIPRMCKGMNGWRIMESVVIAETILYNDYRNEFGKDGEWKARQVATRAQQIAKEYVATVGFLNGAPID